jgi:hypothetical protein
MKTWKRALVFGSFGASAVLLLTRKRPAGIAAATVGLAILASEYPEQFDSLWEHAPEYAVRGIEIFSVLSQFSGRLAGEASEEEDLGRGVSGQP